MFTHSKVDLIFDFWYFLGHLLPMVYDKFQSMDGMHNYETKEIFKRVANLLAELRNKPYPTVIDCIQMSVYLLALRVDALEVS